VRPDSISEEITRIEALVAGLPLPLAQWHLLRVRASRAVLLGDLDEARSLNVAAEQVDLQDPSSKGMSSAFRACMANLTGDPAELGDDWWARLADAPDIPIIDACRAGAHLHQGRVQDAQLLHRKVMPLVPTLPRDGRWSGDARRARRGDRGARRCGRRPCAPRRPPAGRRLGRRSGSRQPVARRLRMAARSPAWPS
jgi:hypothetical protein